MYAKRLCVAKMWVGRLVANMWSVYNHCMAAHDNTGEDETLIKWFVSNYETFKV